MYQEIFDLLHRLRAAKSTALNGGSTRLINEHSAFLEESKRLIFIKVPQTETIDDLIHALILTFEKLYGRDIETGIENAHKNIALWSESLDTLKDMLVIKQGLPVQDTKTL